MCFPFIEGNFAALHKKFLCGCAIPPATVAKISYAMIEPKKGPVSSIKVTPAQSILGEDRPVRATRNIALQHKMRKRNICVQSIIFNRA